MTSGKYFLQLNVVLIFKYNEKWKMSFCFFILFSSSPTSYKQYLSRARCAKAEIISIERISLCRHPSTGQK